MDKKLKDVVTISFSLLGRNKAISLIIASFIIVVFDFLSIALLVPLLKLAQDGSFGTILDSFFGIQKGSEDTLLLAIAIFLVFIFIKNIIVFFTGKQKYKLMFFVQEKLSRFLLREYLKKGFSDFRQLSFAKVSRNVVSETGHFVSSLMHLVDIVIELVVFISIFLFIGSRNPTLYIFLIFFVFVGFLVFTYTKKKLYSIGSIRVQAERERISIIQGIYNLFKEVKIYRAEEYFLKQYDQPNHEVAESHAMENYIRPLSKYTYEVLTIFFIYIFVDFYYGSQFFYENLILILAALFRLFPSFSKIITSLQQIVIHKKSIDGILEAYQKNLIVDDPLAINLDKNNLINNIKVKSFSYHLKSLVIGKKKMGGMSIELGARDKMSLITAESGFGKSLFLSCLVGLIEADGRYTLNLKKIKEAEIQKLNLFSFNSQSATLLNDSIVNNILFDSSHIDLDKKRLEKAIDIADLKSYISELPEGIYTVLSDRGHNLSGGQQQRITLARTIYKNRQIMILDESLSALDKASQIRILNNLKKLYSGKVILVSHDPIDSALFNKVFKL
ncbi:ABC transporter ATP-binding protein/permease [Methylophilaceae bacterium]|nr:ABC transporter ATP-binding protein/permease [Methylophilaceae bacterium]